MNAPFIPAVASAMPPASGAPTRCADEAGAAGNLWYQQPGPLSLILAIGTATTLCEQLERTAELAGAPFKIEEAAQQIGKVDRRYGTAFDTWNRGIHQTYKLKPTNGFCAVSSLWEALGSFREQAIRDQLKSEGVPVYYEMQPWAAGADEAQARYDEIDRDMPTVEAALQEMGVGL